MTVPIYRLQPSEFVDQIRDGQEMTKLPYPFFVNEDGSVRRQDFWKGDPFRVVGFQADLAVHKINLWWADALKDPQKAVGMYVVTVNKSGDMGVHISAIDSVEILEGE